MGKVIRMREDPQPPAPEMEEMKFYNIEQVMLPSKATLNGFVVNYRFYSLFNGTRGGIHTDKSAAVAEGEMHHAIIKAAHRIERIMIQKRQAPNAEEAEKVQP